MQTSITFFRLAAMGAMLNAAAMNTAVAQEEPVIAEAPAVLFDVPPARAELPPTPRRTTDPIAMDTPVPVHRIGPLNPGRVTMAEIEEMMNPSPVRRVGFVRDLPGFGLSIDGGDATVTELSGGEVVWSFTIRADHALRTRLHFTETDLDGAVMTVFSEFDGVTRVRGPYRGAGPRGDGDFWSHSVPGDVIHVEILGTVDMDPIVNMTELVHFDRDPSAMAQAAGGSNGDGVFSCHLDAACQTLPAAARAATGQINYITGGEAKVCSGTLLNDTDNATAIPYFITARHCIDTQAEVNSMEVVWNWERPDCGAALPDYNDLPTSNGGDLLVTYSENDMSFMRLNGGVLTNGLAGWTTNTGLSNARGIHHPSGSYKRAVHLDTVGTCPGCACLDPFDYDYYDMESGLIEGGSSGSGVFNSSGQLAGQLFGICSDFSDPDDMNCSNIDSYWAVYGEFETTWEETDVRFWMLLGGTIYVDEGGLPLCQSGLEICPFVTVGGANSIAFDGARLVIEGGNYPEAVTLNNQLEIITTGGVVTIGQ